MPKFKLKKNKKIKAKLLLRLTSFSDIKIHDQLNHGIIL